MQDSFRQEMREYFSDLCSNTITRRNDLLIELSKPAAEIDEDRCIRMVGFGIRKSPSDRYEAEDTYRDDTHFIALAAGAGKLDLVKQLHQKEIGSIFDYGRGDTPLISAAKNGHVNVLAYLEQAIEKLAQEKPIHIPATAKTAYERAQANGMTNVIQYFLQKDRDKLEKKLIGENVSERHLAHELREFDKKAAKQRNLTDQIRAVHLTIETNRPIYEARAAEAKIIRAARKDKEAIEKKRRIELKKARSTQLGR